MRGIIVFVLLIHFFCPIKVSAQKDAQSKYASTLARNEFLITGKIIGRDTGNLVLLYYDKVGKFAVVIGAGNPLSAAWPIATARR